MNRRYNVIVLLLRFCMLRKNIGLLKRHHEVWPNSIYFTIKHENNENFIHDKGELLSALAKPPHI